MKEKDFEKCLDNLIIDGLIKEAEQNNADFEAAMRQMSNEDFLALIYDNVSLPAFASYTCKSITRPVLRERNSEKIVSNSPIQLPKGQILTETSPSIEECSGGRPTMESEQKRKNWKPWVAAIASAAAILLIVLIPVYNNVNSRLCESALLASSTYVTPSRGGDDVDIASMPKAKVESMIPKLQEQYTSLLQEVEMAVADEPEEVVTEEYYVETSNPMEVGMQLVQAYLRTNQKAKAVELLRELSNRYENSEFGNHCMKLLEILE